MARLVERAPAGEVLTAQRGEIAPFRVLPEPPHCLNPGLTAVSYTHLDVYKRQVEKVWHVEVDAGG